jgi:hypothetical protein
MVHFVRPRAPNLADSDVERRNAIGLRVAAGRLGVALSHYSDDTDLLPLRRRELTANGRPRTRGPLRLRR